MPLEPFWRRMLGCQWFLWVLSGDDVARSDTPIPGLRKGYVHIQEKFLSLVKRKLSIINGLYVRAFFPRLLSAQSSCHNRPLSSTCQRRLVALRKASPLVQK